MDRRQENPRPYHQQEQMISYGSDSLFRVVCGVCEYPRIDSMLYPVGARDNDPINHGMDEVVIEKVFPDGLYELTPAVSHKLTTLRVPLWMPA